MTLQKIEVRNEWQPYKRTLCEIYNKRAEEAEKLESELAKDDNQQSADIVDAIRAALDNITAEAEKIAELLENWDAPAQPLDSGERSFNPLKATEIRSLSSANFSNGLNQNQTEKRGYSMPSFNVEIENEKREFFSKFVENRAAGDSSTMSAVIPSTIMTNYVIETAPGAFYEGASITTIAHAGTLKLPIAALQTINEHTENAEITPAGYVPSTLAINHKEYAYNTGFSDLGVVVGVESFSSIIDNTLIGSMLKKFDSICLDAVAGLTYTTGTNALEYANGSAPTYADFVTLAGMLGADYVGGAAWFMSPATYFKLVMGLKDTDGKPILDPSKKVEDNALLGYGFKLDSQIPTGVIYFGDVKRVHFNAARPAELNRWTDWNKNSEMAGIRSVAGAACEVGAFVKMSEAATSSK